MYGTHYTTAQETVMGSDLQVLQLHNKDKTLDVVHIQLLLPDT